MGKTKTPKQRTRQTSTKSKFTPEEDEALRKIVNEIGFNDWPKVASLMPGRSGRQCRDRWTNYIDPTLTQNPWTKADDIQLLKRYHEIGAHWRVLANCFPGRSINGVRNRVIKLIKNGSYDSKRRRKQKDDSFDEYESDQDYSFTESPVISSHEENKEEEEEEEKKEEPKMDVGDVISTMFNIFNQSSESFFLQDDDESVSSFMFL